MRVASAQAMAIVKSTAPALQKHGLAITTAMYARLFENREIEAMFDRAAQVSGEHRGQMDAQQVMAPSPAARTGAPSCVAAGALG